MEGVFNIRLIKDMHLGYFKCPVKFEMRSVANSFNWSFHSESYISSNNILLLGLIKSNTYLALNFYFHCNHFSICTKGSICKTIANYCLIKKNFD